MTQKVYDRADDEGLLYSFSRELIDNMYPLTFPGSRVGDSMCVQLLYLQSLLPLPF